MEAFATFMEKLKGEYFLVRINVTWIEIVA